MSAPAQLPAVDGRQWYDLAAVDDVPEDEGLQVRTTPPVALFGDEGELFALDDTCTHETYSLAQGWVEDCSVECPLHAARFDLRTGAALCLPATRGVQVHPVQEVDGRVWVALPTTYSLPDAEGDHE